MLTTVKTSQVRVGDAMLSQGRYYVVERIEKTGKGREAEYRFYCQGRSLTPCWFLAQGWASVDRKETGK